MPEPLGRLHEAMSKKRGITPFVGSGLTIEATRNAPQASWSGLILDGIELCQRTLPDLRPGWSDTLVEHLQQGDVTSYLTAAQEVSARLQGWAGGRIFANWLADGVGGLKAVDAALPKAVGRLGSFILTTNYDTIIEQENPRLSTTSWNSKDAMSVFRSWDETVFHLHGVASDPTSIIFGWSDYQHLSDTDSQSFVKKVLTTTETLLFIGCGAGLDDPSVGPALQFADNVMPEDAVEHFLLVAGKDLRSALMPQRPRSITPVAYGADHLELSSFLDQLADGRVPNVTQDPAAYDIRFVSMPRIALLDLAGPADERIGDAIEATRRALRAIGQLERRTASPAGMLTWDLADQEAVLEQLAAAGAAPAARLGASVAQLAVAIQNAGDLASQLLAPRFAERRKRLNPLVRNIEELNLLVIDLEGRLAVVLADVRERAQNVGAYRTSIQVLKECADHVEEARQSTTDLLDGFQTNQTL